MVSGGMADNFDTLDLIINPQNILSMIEKKFVAIPAEKAKLSTRYTPSKTR